MDRLSFYRRLVLAACLLLCVTASPVLGQRGRQVISLAGTWQMALDPQNQGEADRWYERALQGSIVLPASLDEARIGEPESPQELRLTRRHAYVGQAWYTREIDIPAGWRGKHVELLLERTRTTRLWLDGRPVGPEQMALSVPHVYDLTGQITPGRHRIAVLVDNKKLPSLSGHSVGNETQVNSNGILGRIELIASDPVHVAHVRVTPDVVRRVAWVELVMANGTGRAASGSLTLSARAFNTEAAHTVVPVRRSFRIQGARDTLTVELPMGEGVLLWDEFSPALYRLEVTLETPDGNRDRRDVEFGMRSFERQGNRLVVNGRPVFLRGTHEGLTFPLTGHPPMDLEGWMTYFRTLKDYGLNHVRFHSSTPPEAAFRAADRMGFYLQPEGPHWGRVPDLDQPVAQFILEESRQILDAYGNSPSFCMYTLVNEGNGKRETFAAIVRQLRRHDGRPLYAIGSNNFFWDPKQQEGDDFWVTMRTMKGTEGATRGSFSHADLPLGQVETGPPNTRRDYSPSLRSATIPVIGHETGQYLYYPGFDEIDKYMGVLAPYNLERLRERARQSGVLDRRLEYFQAAGQLATLMYREEIEEALRTPSMGGFQLLDLKDYPGQGTALVGVLDAFMETKGLISPRQWRQFCSEVVPLLRYDRFTWTGDETFTADVEVAQYGPRDLQGATIEWILRDDIGNAVRSGVLPAKDLETGNLRQAGSLQIPLGGLKAPARYNVDVAIRGTDYRNAYPVWLYPAKGELAVPAGIEVVRSLDAGVMQRLEQGGRVILIPDTLKQGRDPLFMTTFWSFPMFDQIARNNKVTPSPGTMGLLIREEHPALAAFPTEMHTNWQWWHLVRNSRSAILNELTPSLRPIVEVIDNAYRADRMGLVFEARVGKGKLLVSTIDLPAMQERPEARQLYASLLQYAGSDAFAPEVEVPAEILLQHF